MGSLRGLILKMTFNRVKNSFEKRGLKEKGSAYNKNKIKLKFKKYDKFKNKFRLKNYETIGEIVMEENCCGKIYKDLLCISCRNDLDQN